MISYGVGYYKPNWKKVRAEGNPYRHSAGIVKLTVIKTGLQGDHKDQRLKSKLRKRDVRRETLHTVPEANSHAAHEGQGNQAALQKHQENVLRRNVLVKDLNH